MILPDRKKEEIEPKQAILVAQDVAHIGAMHGLISNGGKKSVGKYIVEFVNNGSKFTTIQIYECALGVKPKVQSWNRTKTVVEKKVVYKKPETKQAELKVKAEVKSEDLF